MNARAFATNYKIKKQYRVKLDREKGTEFKIDLVILEKGSNKIIRVMDTKYKREENPLTDDIQQIIAYADSMQTKKAFLVYPSLVTDNFSKIIGDAPDVKTITFARAVCYILIPGW